MRFTSPARGAVTEVYIFIASRKMAIPDCTECSTKRLAMLSG